MSDAYNKYLDILNKHPEFDKYKERILEELNFIEQNNFFKSLDKLYKKITNNPERKGDINPLNSVVGYLLGLTSCPPSDNFHIERRRTYARAGFPDIDMDFDYKRRPQVIEYIINKYGREYVGNIGTRQTMEVKAALRRVCKVLDPKGDIKFDKHGKRIKEEDNASFAFENELLKTLPEFLVKENGEKVETVKDAYESFSEFRKYMDLYPEVYKVARRVQGCVSGLSLHAAGMVISPIPLSEICPLCITQGKEDREEDDEDKIGTAFPAGDLESQGLLKIDVLGIATRAAISECMTLIKNRYGREASSQIDLENLPLNDEPTYKLIQDGLTVGVFQLESWGMRQSLKEVGVNEFKDLIALVALYRPGPKAYIPMYARRKRGQEKTVYAHPAMEKNIKSTYGVICFQEQLMSVFVDMAGLSVTDGFYFQKGCAKKKQAIVDGYQDMFIKGAIKNGASQLVAEKIWADMKAFGEYAFNLNHAASYAYEAYKTAFLKTHYPMEFICARMNVELERKKYKKVAIYEKDARENFGIEFKPPHLNNSREVYTIVGERTIQKGFMTKGLSLAAATEIVKHQPYTEKKNNKVFFDFATKVGTAVNTKVIETMCDIGALNGKSKKEIVRMFEQIKKDKKSTKGRPFGQAFE